jgi:hypothetical protein
VNRWDKLGLEGAARTAYKLLRRENKKLLVADFAWPDNVEKERFAFVFAVGERADEVKRRLADLLEEERYA